MVYLKESRTAIFHETCNFYSLMQIKSFDSSYICDPGPQNQSEVAGVYL